MIFLTFFLLFTASVRSRPPGPPAVPGVFSLDVLSWLTSTAPSVTTPLEMALVLLMLVVGRQRFWSPGLGGWLTVAEMLMSLMNPILRVPCYSFQKLRRRKKEKIYKKKLLLPSILVNLWEPLVSPNGVKSNEQRKKREWRKKSVKSALTMARPGKRKTRSTIYLNTNIPPSMVRRVTGSLRRQSIHQYIIMIEVLGVTWHLSGVI